MAKKIDKEDLDEVMTKAGIGSRNRKLMHKANGTDGSDSPASPAAPRGHGAARPYTPVIDEL